MSEAECWAVGVSNLLWLVLGVIVAALAFMLSCAKGCKPVVICQQGSAHCQRILEECPALRNNYVPPMLWGWSGHLQTLLFAVLGRVLPRPPRGERHNLTVGDGSTVTYDLFEPQNTDREVMHTVLICPGINNTSETDYIQVVTHCMLQNGHRVVVFNHTGALRNTPLTGARIFTYGGTGDLTAVFNDLLKLFPGTRFIGLGYSMGAGILVRFLGEREERQKHFVCAISICQGYAIHKADRRLGSTFGHLYNTGIAKRQLKLIRFHQAHVLRRRSYGDASCEVQHDGHDSNGFALDSSRLQLPDEERLWKANNIQEIDEYYTRRVMGFKTVQDLHEWSSCAPMMNRIPSLPMLFINAKDDPIVSVQLHKFPIKYTGTVQSKRHLCQHGLRRPHGFLRGLVSAAKCNFLA
ncbi:hypothetical protein EMCRGX_G029858 [Ephydatia muelleri]